MGVGKMITISKVDKKDIDFILNSINDKGLKINDIKENFLVIYDNVNILGYGGFDVYNSICIMNSLEILDQSVDMIMRDGLIKALVNLADLNKHKIFIIKKDEYEKFYNNLGFNELSNREFILELDLIDKEYIYADINNFFNQPCRCKNNN